MFTKLYLSPQPRYPRTLPEMLTAVAALLTRQQPDDAQLSVMRAPSQQITHIEFWMLEQLGHELATLTPMAWVDIVRRRFSLRQTAATTSEQLPYSASTCSSYKIPRRLLPSGCRGSRSEFPVLFHLCSQPDRRELLGLCLCSFGRCSLCSRYGEFCICRSGR